MGTATYVETHSKGAANELYAALHFVRQGHQVYWPQVKQDATDFILERDGALYRVQVKTAWWNRVGAHSYLQARMRSTGKYTFSPASGLYELMVIVFEEEMWAIPAHLIKSSNICLRGSRPGRKPEAWDSFKVK